MAERVVVGMSGGVDSSVAAALLVEQGFEVIGVTMHLAGSQSRCCSLDDADDARRVAEQLGIRFYVANYKDRFREEVIEPFADAYLAGRTPIPCVACNDRFKFSHLLARARALGADAVATGHYARIERDAASGAVRLLRGADVRKDQSYFLFRLSTEQLRNTHFPLGALAKPEVRERARALGLATAEKAESQEICFVPDGNYARVVEQIRPGAARAGEIVEASTGRVVGSHAGIHHFTVGQRRGLGSGGAEPRYVVGLDAARARVLVGDERALGARGARVTGVCWTRGDAPPGELRAEVQVRYKHAPAHATIVPASDGSARIAFDAPVRAVAPGQAAVFYQGDELIGGGWLAEALP
ncbi:MAG TPA: tRNA 2-thiouridine(34) synthase MnmA [Myxococcota bacterium]|jgi:tRNA-specific 2-thiouridylase